MLATCLCTCAGQPEHGERPAAVQSMKTSMGTKLVSPNYWKTLVPPALVQLPGIMEAIQPIMLESDVALDVTPFTLASKVLDHANTVIRGFPSHCLFKIGQTCRPVHRWTNRQYGYKHACDQWTLLPLWSKMRIVGVLAHGESAGFMEAALISAWSCDSRCLNQAGGGEAVAKQEGPFFVYVVVSHSR